MNSSISYLLLAAVLLCFSACRFGQEKKDTNTGGEETLHYAKNFTITRHDSYTQITVLNPWDTNQVLREYILSDNDAEPEAANNPNAVYIKTPLKSVGVLGVVHAGILEMLGTENLITGVADPQYMNFNFVQKGLREGRIVHLGESSQLNIEKLIETAPDALFVTTFPKAGYGKLDKASIPIVECVEYMEHHPLGRAEWIKFIGAFIGKSREADSIYNAIEQNYLEAKKIAEKVSHRPTVFSEKKYRGVWNIPGGGSYMSIFFHDAGADYLWREDTQTGSLSLPFEEVYEKAEKADFWFIKYNKPNGNLTYSEVQAEYEPYALFDAWKNRQIVGCNADKTPYYERGIMQPDMVLKDMISIFHPELANNHQSVYFHLLP